MSWTEIISVQLNQYLGGCHVFVDKQFGFRAHHSADHALICITQSASSSLGNVEVHFGLPEAEPSKDFDSVKHNIPLRNLSQYGIDHPRSEKNISRRFQCVWDCDYGKGNFCSGVPQGSVFGPHFSSYS